MVYVGTGRYDEALTLVAGITLQGGWNTIDGDWTRQCKTDRASSVLIASPSSIGVRAEYDGQAGLDTLTVRTKAGASAQESLYGIFVRGASTKLTLENVEVVAADGGSGTDGSPGLNAIAATTIECAGGDGLAGAVVSELSAGAMQGTYDADGFHAGHGAMGLNGNAGSNGTAGAVICVDCVAALAAHTATSGPPSCASSPSATICTTPPTPLMSCGAIDGPGANCGGGAGGGGMPGTGGGSSIALFVWNGADVEVRGGRFQSGAGGLAGHGGAAGRGAAGGLGNALTQAGPPCAYNIRLPGSPGMVSASPLPGGSAIAFGPGGQGSDGGRAGDGAGGDSFAVVSGGGAVVAGLESATLMHAVGGAAVGNGGAGRASDIGPAP